MPRTARASPGGYAYHVLVLERATGMGVFTTQKGPPDATSVAMKDSHDGLFDDRGCVHKRA